MGNLLMKNSSPFRLTGVKVPIRHRAVHTLKNRFFECIGVSFSMLQCNENASRGWISVSYTFVTGPIF